MILRFSFCSPAIPPIIRKDQTANPAKSCPAQSDKSPQSRTIDRGIPASGCAFGCLRRNRSCRPGLLRSEKDGLLAYPWGLSSSLPPSGTAVLFECGLGLVHECGVPASSCFTAFTASSQPWKTILLIDVHRTAHDNQPIETSHFW